MRILLTGANGYIGARLLPLLLEEGHHVIALLRHPKRFDISSLREKQVTTIFADLLDKGSLEKLPKQIDAAYYLVHSMSDSAKDFSELEEESAKNFIEALEKTEAKQIVYLSGLSSDASLSPHLSSRRKVEQILSHGSIPCTTLRSGVIIGSGSASFEIIRDLVEKLPLMIAPRWVRNRTQPIAVSDVLFYLKAVLNNPDTFRKAFEIGGPDVLTYREMLLRYASIRGLRRYVINVPVLTPKLSSYWLYFVTSTNFSLASSLVDSLRNETICSDFQIQKLIPHQCLKYEEAISRALEKIEQNAVVSSWRDAIVLSRLQPNFQEHIRIPATGCLSNKQRIEIHGNPQASIDALWAIGGETGWYYANWAWKIRGFVDKLCGGAGLNRGRTNTDKIETGDAIDFWRVLAADKTNGRLLLYAEMKLPGEAWLEFRICRDGPKTFLEQTATFRPKGVLGRLYWYSLLPIHNLIFHGMARAIVRGNS
ncbi:MAG: SDR family oxidoreductase [Verrucomicrobia bacterium]|nr:SDR family oxidoreductase [Verrucomicrobiota bacterium]